MTDWSDPSARARLAARLGPTEYHRLLDEYLRASVVATVNGRDIRTLTTRFGTLYAVDGGVAFATLPEPRLTLRAFELR
jgi:hypothetical protein